MSIESKDVTGPRTAPIVDGHPGVASPQARKRGRLPGWVRFGTPIAILAIAALVESYIWIKNEGDGTFQVMLTWYTVPVFVLGLLVWWTFLSGFAWTIRLAGLGLLALASLALGFTFRLKEFSGNMVPHFESRWRPSAEQKAADYWQNETSRVSTDTSPVAKEAGAIEKLAIGLGDWPQFDGAHSAGLAPGVRIRIITARIADRIAAEPAR